MKKLPYILVIAASVLLVGCGATVPAPVQNPKPAVTNTKQLDKTIDDLKKQLVNASTRAERLRILNQLADDKAVKIFEGK